MTPPKKEEESRDSSGLTMQFQCQLTQNALDTLEQIVPDESDAYMSREQDDEIQLDQLTRTTPLLLAAAEGRTNDMRILLQEDVYLLAKDEAGRSAMHWGALQENINVCWLLLRHGLDIDVCDHQGQTPLHLAAKYGHVLTVRYLLDHGACPDALDNENLTPAQWAAIRGHDDVLQLFANRANNTEETEKS